jgi:hydroxymethylbilane synthase
MSTPIKLRLGTRASQLALWQSNWVRDQLIARGIEVELIEIRTTGDIATQPLAQIGGQGLFTKRLQDALLNQEIDLAVHSLKDLPTEDHPQLTIAAIPEREIRNDALIVAAASGSIASTPNNVPVTTNFTQATLSPKNTSRSESAGHNPFANLATGATIGTGSVRRAAQLLHLRPDLKIVDIRGNVDTRLKKLDTGEYDAIILAAAGLTRLGWKDRITYPFPFHELTPAVGQGALGLETRTDDSATIEMLQPLNHPASYHAAIAERAMLRTLFAGCLSPVGAETTFSEDQLSLRGVVLSRDGQQKMEAERSGPLDQSTQLGVAVAEALLNDGAGVLLSRDV